MLARYIVQRIWQLIPVLILVSMAVFLIVRIIPGDPVLVMMGIDAEERTRISEEQYHALQQQLGFDRPIYVQYLSWLKRIVQGDLGLSLRSRRPIFETIFERFPATIYLAIVALLTGVAIAIPAGVIAAMRQNTGADYAAMGFALWGIAMPNFWLALMLIVLFSVILGWLPAIGYASPFDGSVLIIAVTYVFINLFVDIVYKWLDPRIKLE